MNDSPPGVDPRIDELQRQIEALRAHLDRVTAASRLQKAEIEALRSRVAQMQALLNSVNRRVFDIYESKIWRTLVQLGQNALDTYAAVDLGRRRIRDAFDRLQGAWVRAGSSEKDQIAVFCDSLNQDSPATIRERTEITGYACARSGVAAVEIFLGSIAVEPVATGIARPEVPGHLAAFPGADQSGFKALLDPSRVDAGPQSVRVVVTATSGLKSEAVYPVVIDHRAEYDVWVERHNPEKIRHNAMRQIAAFTNLPKISVITPVFRTPPAQLDRCIESVYRQMYPHWEHILVDDGSHSAALMEALEKWARTDERIRVFSLDENAGIAAATNYGLSHATGEFAGFLDHDDELAPHALFKVADELDKYPDLDLFYSDEDKISPEGKRFDPFFKPSWSPDLLLSVNYMCHFLVCRRSLAESIGRLRLGFEGSQDYDFILRLVECTDRIRRIPDVLYHWRVSETSTASGVMAKPEASNAGERALQDHLNRTAPGATATTVSPGHYRVRYPLPTVPEVAVIIPSGGNQLLATALEHVLSNTTYPSLQIVVVDNSKDERVRNIVRKFENRGKPVQTLDCRRLPFNFSLLCNRAARAATADYLLFLNDDTSVITPDWLETMMEHAQRPEVGAVGNLLLFPDSRIQHAGVLMGIHGLAGHSFRLLDSTREHYFQLPALTRNCSAVTGACLLTRKDVFWEVEGFDEQNLPISFQDVDLCLKMHERGYRIIYTPHAQLFHYESASKTKVAFHTEIEYMQNRWREYIEDDPYYNPNLTRVREDYTLDL